MAVIAACHRASITGRDIVSAESIVSINGPSYCFQRMVWTHKHARPATHRSQRSLQVSQSVRGWTSWPRHVGVGATVEFVEAVVVVAVAVGIVCGPRYSVDEDVLYGSVVEQFACTESNCSIR